MAVLSNEKSPIAFRGYTMRDNTISKLLTFDKRGRIHTFSIKADYGAGKGSPLIGCFIV